MYKRKQNKSIWNWRKTNFLKIPSTLEGFINTNTTIENDSTGHKRYYFKGYIPLPNSDLKCDICGNKMNINRIYNIKLKHLSIGEIYSSICVERKQLQCSCCSATKKQNILFKDSNFLITKELKTHIIDLLATNKFNLKDIVYLTGINRNIDKERLQQNILLMV